jgi:stage V sporulation protein B
MKIDKYYKDSLILTLSNLVTGIIGFLFSIIITKNLGAEGLGLYSIIMPVYGLLLCLTSEGLVTAISKISAVYCSKKDQKNLNRTITTTFVLIFLWSLGIAMLTFLASSNISDYFIRDKRASDAIKILCPALIFVPLSTIIKGYFYGSSHFMITASVDIVEKLLRVLIFLGSIAILSINDVKNMVSAAYIALTTGEMASLIILYSFYRVYKNKNKSTGTKIKARYQLMFDVLVISCPLCINGFLSSLISTTSILLLPRRIVQAGFSYNEALTLIGKFSGMAMNIIYLPFIIIGSMLTVLIPDLSTSVSKKDACAAENRIAQVLKTTCLVGISTVAIALTIPDLLGELLYGKPELGGMIKFASIAGFTSYISSPTFGILNGLGKQNLLLRNSLVVSVEGLVLVFFLTSIPSMNIYGLGISIIITSITAFVLNMVEIRKYYEVKFTLSRLTTIFLTGVVTFLFLRLINILLVDSNTALRAVIIVLAGFLSIFLITAMVEKVNNL